RLLVELRRLRTRVGDEDVERAEALLDLAEHPAHVVDARDVGLDEKPVGAVLTHALERVLRGGLVRVVMDGDPRAALRELQRDAPADAPRSPRHPRVLSLQ